MKSAFGLRRIMPSFAGILTIAAIGLLTGCGQKGPLYMPNTGIAQPADTSSGTTAAPVPATAVPESSTPAASPATK